MDFPIQTAAKCWQVKRDKLTPFTWKELTECVTSVAEFTRRRKCFRICHRCFCKFLSSFPFIKQLSKLSDLKGESGDFAVTSLVV